MLAVLHMLQYVLVPSFGPKRFWEHSVELSTVYLSGTSDP